MVKKRIKPDLTQISDLDLLNASVKLMLEIKPYVDQNFTLEDINEEFKRRERITYFPPVRK